MLDIKTVREDPERVKKKVALRGKSYDEEIDRIVALDVKRRDILYKAESMKAEQNRISKSVPEMKKKGEDVSALFADMKKMSEEIRAFDAEVAQIEEESRSILLGIPNMPADKVPVGKDSDDNVEIRRWGEVRSFDFEPKAHWDIGEELGILDPAAAAKVTGARFHFYKGAGARLERAVINYFLDTHVKNGYTEIFPPFMANSASMRGTGQLPKFAEDMFKLEGMDYYLIPTAEVPVTNFYRDDIIDEKDLPIWFCAYSACFRAEAGSAGRDTRGLIRQHQFNKVELVKFTSPETSYDELESLTREAEGLLSGLELPYRVVALCTGDMGFSSACTYDIEVYMPSYGKYVEISSCSNFEDFQARRANIKCKAAVGAKPRLCHTLNGSGLAVGRTVACILETYQNADGSVTVPKALRPYMGGLEKIEAIK